MKKELNLIVPTCWQELTQQQLRYLLFLMAQGYTPAAVKTYALMRFAKVDLLPDTPGVYTVFIDGSPYRLTATQVAEVLPALDWITQTQTWPTRLMEVQGKKAIDNHLQGLSLYNYMVLETYYQQYLHTKNQDLIDGMAAILYDPDGLTSRQHPAISLLPEERIGCVLWFEAVKANLARRFSHFFVGSAVEAAEDAGNVAQRLQQAFDTQLRALTGGDITKEDTILDIDMYRALTELDAKAEEFEELKKMHK